MSHPKEVILLACLAAGCASVRAPAVEPLQSAAASWRLAERDGLVVFEPEWAQRRFEVRYVGPDHPDVGQIVEVEIRVPGAPPGERRRFRVRTTRASVRLVDAASVETIGDAPARVRFTADACGRGGVEVAEQE